MMDRKLIPIFVVYLIVYTSALDVRPLVKTPGKLPPTGDTPDDRIINGFTPGQFDHPYVALLTIRISQTLGASCTGSLIHPNWVVTAGHCAKRALSIRVELGLYNRNTGPKQVITVPSSSIYVHPNFVANSSDIINDIALLRLNPRANTAFREIQPIPYVCASAGTLASQTGTACGWGITKDNGSIPIIVQCANLLIITNIECQLRWGRYINPTNICTRTVNQITTCHGDSGGPLTVINGASRRRKLVGATSFGSDPCASSTPDAFTRVAAFEPWIRSISGIACDPR